MNQTISFSTNQTYALTAVLALLFAVLASPAVYLQVGNFIGNATQTQLVQPGITTDLDNKLVIVHALVFAGVALILLKNFNKIVKID